MRVLLVSANTELINMPVLPLGMACVARAAEDAGHEVTQINLIANPDALGLLHKTIKKIQPEIIGISVRNIDDQVSSNPRFLLEPVKEIISTCRSHSKAKVVLGGAGYSIFPLQALKYLGVDIGIQGEGEKSFTMLLNKIEAHEDLSKIPGLICISCGITNPPERTTDLDSLVLPQAGKLVWPMEPPVDEVIWLPFQTRRGCPMNCSYCSTAAIEGRIIRKRQIDHVIESMVGFVSAGFDHFYFVDNTFNLPPSYAKSLCDRICFSGLKIGWRGILYPWKIDEELVSKMAESGCVEISLGFESGSDYLLRKMNKRYRTEDVRYASDLLKAYNIRRMGFLLLGGPGENQQTVQESLEFADSLALEMVKVTIGLRIYPNTPLASYARQTGKILPYDSLLFPKFYIENGMETWLRETVEAWIKDRPNWFY